MCKLLAGKFGIVDFQPLKPIFMNIWEASSIDIPGPGDMPYTSVDLLRNSNSLPKFLYTLDTQKVRLNEAHTYMTVGKFSDAISGYRNVLHLILFIEFKKEIKEEVMGNLISRLLIFLKFVDSIF